MQTFGDVSNGPPFSQTTFLKIFRVNREKHESKPGELSRPVPPFWQFRIRFGITMVGPEHEH